MIWRRCGGGGGGGGCTGGLPVKIGAGPILVESSHPVSLNSFINSVQVLVRLV